MDRLEFYTKCRDFANEHGMVLSQERQHLDPSYQGDGQNGWVAELNKDNDYFISIECDLREEKPYQVFEAYIGWTPEIDTDTELWEYGNYTHLGTALNNALTNSSDGRKPRRVWN